MIGTVEGDMDESTAADLMELGGKIGLDAVGITKAEVFASTRRDIEERLAAGHAAGMQFTYRNPERSTDPSRVLDGARSIVVGALAYPADPSGSIPSRVTSGLRTDPPGAPQAARYATDRNGNVPLGRVARYAWDDHYSSLRNKLGDLARFLESRGWRTRVVVDNNALVDREAAYRAGIGWYGKNAMMLLPRRGSWFVLGSVVTDAPLTTPDRRVPDGCGSCTRCISSCPTGAIVAPGVVDARRCLAWLLQAPGDFPLEHRAALGNRVYGCDDCQEVCPQNSLKRTAVGPREAKDAWPRGGAPGEPSDEGSKEVSAPDLVEMILAEDTELMARFGRWYIAERDPRYLRRNALVALGNIGDGANPRVESALKYALSSCDGIVESHARWAAEKMGRADLISHRSPAGRSMA